MNILDIAKRTVLAYPGSYAGMAAAMGMSPHVLRNKVSRTNETHHLSLLEAREICEHAADANVPDPFALVRCMAAEFGFQLVREGEGRGASDMSVAEKLMETTLHTAELSRELIHSLADGEISAEEMERITERRRRATQTAVELEEVARGFVAQPNVANLRRNAA
ncbi:phage regulatory CII family protein [Luteibacter sp. E-22]|uniref:phage regulatory CII family protein n=1 Tax=Luteibacter sp. E-22 TaxID=3404050 RepID=UPI003CF8C2D5